MSEIKVSGFTGKSVRATGCPPALTMKRSCFPAASHKNATVFPSGDHCCSVGYLISAMRSIVMLPFGACSAEICDTEATLAINKRAAKEDLMFKLHVSDQSYLRTIVLSNFRMNLPSLRLANDLFYHWPAICDLRRKIIPSDLGTTRS
jgi:hypothetical protein